MLFAVKHDHTEYSNRLPTSRTHPAVAYRSYLDAIAQRDIEAVLEALTDEFGQQLRDLRRSSDFSAFFGLWCESQCNTTVITGFLIKGDHSIVQARGKEIISRICMRWEQGYWRIASERHVCVRSGRKM